MSRPIRHAALAAALVAAAVALVAPGSAQAQEVRPDPPAILGAVDGYWMLDRDGWVYGFGAALDLGNPSALLGDRQAVGLAPHPDARGYWVLADDGSVYGYGSASYLGGGLDPSLLLPGERASTISATPSGLGYWIFTDRGRAVARGDAVHHGDLVELGLGGSLNGPIVDAVAQADGTGYYMVGSDGGVFAFGSARFAGSMGSTPLNAPVNGLAPDRDGTGYRLVASDGGVFAFDADFRGSMGSTPLNAPVVGMIGYGDGYLMVASDGGIFNFSGRDFVGSFGGRSLPAPIVGVAGLPASITGSLWRLPIEDARGGDGVLPGVPASIAPVAFSRRSTDGLTFPVPPELRDQTVAVTGDLDGDGVDDIVIGGRRSTEASIVWFRWTGSSWHRHTIEPDSLRLEAGGALGDIDGDGDLDLVVGEDTTGDELWWWENPAPATPDRWVRRVIKRGFGNQHHDQLLADLDGDGRLELAFWNQKDGNALRIAEIPTDPTVEPWPSGVIFRGASTSEGLAAADVDGDGQDDLVAGGYWFSAANGVYTAHEIDRSMSATRVVVGQLVAGGRPEVVFDSGDGVGRLRMYRWDGSAWVGRDLLDEDSVHGHSLDLGDVNRDGHLDLFSAEVGVDGDHPQVRVLYGNGAGGFAHQIVSGGVGLHESGLADVDGDGDLDIVGKPLLPDDPSITVWINEGGWPGRLGGWHRHVVDDAVGHRTIFVEHADLDGDGVEDVLTGGWWWRNTGTIGDDWPRRTIGAGFGQVYLAEDLDGDGDVDLFGGDAEGSRFDGDLRWAENDGTGSFTVHDNIESADGALLQGAVVVELVPGVTSIALSFDDAVGGLQLVTLPPAGRRATATWTVDRVAEVAGEELAAGDVDGDGDVDLFDGVAWFRNDGGSLTRVPVVPVGDGEADRVALADIDSDGDLDGVVTFGHDGVGRVRWYAQPDDPTAPWAERVIDDLGDANALSLDVGDLDGDGDVDVIVGEHTNPSTDGLRTLVYENVSGSFRSRAIEAGDEHHDGTQLVDLDGDGDLDVVSIGWLHRRLIVLEHVG
ncbi:MAG: VCBS repeat-containing protein [Actinomycetota bacterium]